MALLCGMMRRRALQDGVIGIVQRYNEELKEKALWDVWLHRVYDQSYAEFAEGLDKEKDAPATEERVQEIVEDSKTILGMFVPAGVE